MPLTFWACVCGCGLLFPESSVSLRPESSGMLLKGRGVQKLPGEGPPPSADDKRVTLIEIEL